MKFRGSITQRLISLSTLRDEGYPSPRKTRFRLPVQLCRTGLVPRRVPMKGLTLLILLSRATWRKVRPSSKLFRVNKLGTRSDPMDEPRAG